MAREDGRLLKEKFALRLPDGMLNRIGAAARANNRSMNAEIVARLEGSFQSEASGLEKLIQSREWIELETRVGILESILKVGGNAK